MVGGYTGEENDDEDGSDENVEFGNWLKGTLGITVPGGGPAPVAVGTTVPFEVGNGGVSTADRNTVRVCVVRRSARVIVNVEATTPDGALEINVTLPVDTGITVTLPAGNGGVVAVALRPLDVSGGSVVKKTVPDPSGGAVPVGPAVDVPFRVGNGGSMVGFGRPVMVPLPTEVPPVNVGIAVTPVPEIVPVMLPKVDGDEVEFVTGNGGSDEEMVELVLEVPAVNVDITVVPVPEMVKIVFAGREELIDGKGGKAGVGEVVEFAVEEIPVKMGSAVTPVPEIVEVALPEVTADVAFTLGKGGLGTVETAIVAIGEEPVPTGITRVDMTVESQMLDVLNPVGKGTTEELPVGNGGASVVENPPDVVLRVAFDVEVFKIVPLPGEAVALC
ncbi:hypothetical protein CGCSCA5_v008761 [Colletotrichum siamense]|nr:hypothetical protein CGCSCA5_v008761 [Colletotrichum siamense]